MKRYIKSSKTVDLRGAHVPTLMPSSYKRTAKLYYQQACEALKDDPSILQNIDVSSVEDVVRRACDLIVSDIATQLSCYNVAAAIGAMFDALGVNYTCYSGFATSKQGDYYYMPSNHVWVESNGKIYEVFPKLSGPIYHYNISDTIDFLN